MKELKKKKNLKIGRKSRQYSKKNTHLQINHISSTLILTYLHIPTDMFVHLNLELKPLL